MTDRQIDQRQVIGKTDDMLYYINMFRMQYEKSQKGNRIHQMLALNRVQPNYNIPYGMQTRLTIYDQTRLTKSREDKPKTFEYFLPTKNSHLKTKARKISTNKNNTYQAKHKHLVHLNLEIATVNPNRHRLDKQKSKPKTCSGKMRDIQYGEK